MDIVLLLRLIKTSTESVLPIEFPVLATACFIKQKLQKGEEESMTESWQQP